MDKENLTAGRKKRKYNTTTCDWERKYLGSFVVPGILTVESGHVINLKDKITFESKVYFQKPVKGRKRSKLQSCWQHTGLRFKAMKTHLGTIDNDQISFMISNLIDAGVCEFEGQILPTGNNINFNNERFEFNDDIDEIFLEIKVYILVCINV